LAKAQSAPQPAFEVASIKQTPAGTSGGGYNFEPGGRTVVRNFTLKNLIMLAWHVQDFQVQSAAGWMDTTRYDIEAKATGNSSDDQSRLMLQSLLADRVHLAMHRETKELPIFALRRMSSSGRNLTLAKDGSCTPLAAQSATAPSVVSPPSPPCGATFRLIKSQDNGATTMLVEGRGMAMDLLARTFGTLLGRHVTNETDLNGSFDLRLEYKPEDFSAPPMAAAQSTESTAPSFFTALQDQLGLKLETQKGPVEVLVVDHAEMPSPN
jgi:uncharacterized protein (TIGR03435 family)